MAQTMRNVKGQGKRVRETGHKTRLRDVECGTRPPSAESLAQGAEQLAAWLRGETRVMFDEVSDE